MAFPDPSPPPEPNLPAPQPAAPPVLSFTEAQALSVVRSFLQAVLPPGTPVVRGQDNRVAEPVANDFVVITPVNYSRLATNDTSYFDDVITGGVANDVLTVSSIQKLDLGLTTGMLLLDGSWPTMNLATGTVITGQLTGSLGGTGTYRVSPAAQAVSSEIIYAGSRVDNSPADIAIQVDVHGPNSGNNTRVIETLYRSEYAVDFMWAQEVEAVPLYCTDPHQAPFVNDSNQVEYRWSLDFHLQLNSKVRTPQQFATEVEICTVEAATQYAGTPCFATISGSVGGSTLDDLTCSASGMVVVSGSASPTLDPATLSAQGTSFESISGSVSTTLDPAVLSSQGNLAADFWPRPLNNTDTGQVPLTTFASNELIVLAVWAAGNTAFCSGVSSSSGLTWTLRASERHAPAGQLEVWTAPSPGPLTSEIISVPIANRGARCCAAAIDLADLLNPSAPFDSDPSLPVGDIGAGTEPSVSGVSTNNTGADRLLFFAAQSSTLGLNGVASPSGFSRIIHIYSAGNPAVQLAVFAGDVSGPQTGLTIMMGDFWDGNWAAIADAVVLS